VRHSDNVEITMQSSTKFIEHLQAKRGSLLRLKTQLYWYGTGTWDRTTGKVCLILDATTELDYLIHDAATTTPFYGIRNGMPSAAAQLLIDDKPTWVWVAMRDVELVTEPSNVKRYEKYLQKVSNFAGLNYKIHTKE
jgi:hypothetical protein